MAEKTEKPQKQKRPEKAARQPPGKAREAAAVVAAKPREPEPKIPARLRVKFAVQDSPAYRFVTSMALLTT